ncbi:hypothetical protein [uncultured Brachyspira sp.]|uniref:hypothetical protein n=1 Tax=uncultured Brachyspira sp. TaxID=221953 RepID=UPI00262A7B0F|nr:hypothetical protein [uncultured Brachyspira sp.]
MKIVKNLITLALFFIAFFIIYFFIYFLKVLDTNNIYSNINFESIKNLMEHYFFAITVVSAASTMIFIGALNKFVGNISIILTIIILSAFVTLYPAYTIVFDKNVDYLRNELTDKSSSYIDDNGRFFSKIDNYIIRVGYKLLDNTYKNSVFIDPSASGRLYFGDYIYITDKEIALHEVTEVYGALSSKKSSIIFERKSFSNYLSSFTTDVIFGFEVFPIISTLLKLISITDIPTYTIFILFGNFIFLFFSFYMLGLCLFSKQYQYHNILNAFVIYGVIKIILAILIEHYNLLEIIIRNVNFWNMSFSLFIASIIIIIVSLILKKIFNNDKKAKKEI